MAEVLVRELASHWDDSTGSPLEHYAQENPEVHTGSYVIEPGERVPPEGTTSHAGTEISVVLRGEVVLGLPSGERTVGPETLVVIPAGVEHYSENRREEPVRLVYSVLGAL